MKFQDELLHEYNRTYREPFNEYLLYKDDLAIVDEILKVIKSCQRYKSYTILLDSYYVEERPSEIHKILWKYEQDRIDAKKKKRANIYDTMPLDDTACRLLALRYFISVNGNSEYLNVYILLPKLVDKYYFYINGTYYTPMYQIADTTYNSSKKKSASKRNSDNVTKRTIFKPIKTYRTVEKLITIHKEEIPTISYETDLFTKRTSIETYMFAKYGFYGCMEFMHIRGIYVTKEPIMDDNYYSFITKNKGIYISVFKYLFDNNRATQSMVYAIYDSIHRKTTYDEIFTDIFWKHNLGEVFTNREKYEDILESFESVYDDITKETVNLPIEEKWSIYHLVRWMIREYSNLKIKDNSDISTKTLKFAKYISILYSTRLSTNMYRISGTSAKKIELSDIEKVLITPPNCILRKITKDGGKLIPYKSLTSDDDCTSGLKFSFKGISGIGANDKKQKHGAKQAIPDYMRFVHYSHIGILDSSSSSASEPGLSGMLCPYADIHSDCIDEEYQEPLTWEDEYRNLLDTFKKQNQIKEVMQVKKALIGLSNEEEEIMVNVDESLNSIYYITTPIIQLNVSSNDGLVPVNPNLVNNEGGYYYDDWGDF